MIQVTDEMLRKYGKEVATFVDKDEFTKLLNNLDNKGISSKSISNLYDSLLDLENFENSFLLIPFVTLLLYSEGVDPLKYINYVPALFLANIDELTMITIPDNIKSINQYAFSSCTNLKEVTITSGLTINGMAFEACEEVKKN